MFYSIFRVFDLTIIWQIFKVKQLVILLKYNLKENGEKLRGTRFENFQWQFNSKSFVET